MDESRRERLTLYLGEVGGGGFDSERIVLCDHCYSPHSCSELAIHAYCPDYHFFKRSPHVLSGQRKGSRDADELLIEIFFRESYRASIFVQDDAMARTGYLPVNDFNLPEGVIQVIHVSAFPHRLPDLRL